MLSTRRPHESKTEINFIENWIEPLGATPDGFGNYWLTISGTGDDILWSSHTDTVHNKAGTQAIVKKHDIISLNPKSKANCLGADCTAGVWLMREMILSGKPGVYVFHRGEEIGGIGSDYVATHETSRLDGIVAAIALDRKGYNNIITHQGSRCCSDTFGQSLADSLGMDYKLDDTGLFTDTANYTHIIAECSNISVGYFRQHTAKETLDLAFLCRLRESLIALDTQRLVIERNPEIDEYAVYVGDWQDRESDLLYGDSYPYKADWRDSDYRTPVHGDNYASKEHKEMLNFVANHPVETVEILLDLGVNLDELYQMLSYAEMEKR
jgi:hypothetical protein